MHEIKETAVYHRDDLKEYLGLSWRSARAEFKAGRLRLGKRNGRVYAMGSWLLRWLQEGELSRPKAEKTTNGVYK